MTIKGLVTIARTPGGKAEAMDLTAEGRNRAAERNLSPSELVQEYLWKVLTDQLLSMP
jgi:hypothetical protein